MAKAIDTFGEMTGLIPTTLPQEQVELCKTCNTMKHCKDGICGRCAQEQTVGWELTGGENTDKIGE